jgi:hypothetical protein
MEFTYSAADQGSDPPSSPRRRRILWIAVIIATLVVIGGCAAVIALPPMFAARQLDPAINSSTGLPDGRYLMPITASYHRDAECWFRGVPHGPNLPQDFTTDVTVYGSGLVQCAGATYGDVAFVVANGVATISKSNP